MKVFCTDQFPVPLPSGHRFPAEKYRLLRERVAAIPSSSIEFLEAAAASDEQILRAHDQEYLQRLERGELDRAQIRRLGLPWTHDLLVRAKRSAGATIATCRAALTEGIAVSLAGGTHHAFADQPEGFCILNDSVIAARDLQTNGLAGQIAVIDADVHQGNGTASIARRDPLLFTFSIHGLKNFPFRKVHGDLDFALLDGVEDATYLESLRHGLDRALEISKPTLVIYLAGADPFEGDRFSRWRITKQGLARRDELVIGECGKRRIPVAVTMAGGYGRQITDTVDIHAATVQIAVEHWEQDEASAESGYWATSIDYRSPKA